MIDIIKDIYCEYNRLEFKDQANIVLSALSYLGLLVALTLTYIQLRKNDKVSRAQFWLELRQMFHLYDHVHKDLQANPEWRTKEGKDVTPEEAADIVGYMGLFEHCYNMIKEKQIDLRVFKNIYSYRIHVVMNTPRAIEATLVNNGRYWEDFFSLLDLLEYKNLPQRADADKKHSEIEFPVGWS